MCAQEPESGDADVAAAGGAPDGAVPGAADADADRGDAYLCAKMHLVSRMHHA